MNIDFNIIPQSIFITGTDTNIGKSIVTAHLALYFKEKGLNVAISKPIQTGMPKDTDHLKDLVNGKIPIFNSYTLNLPAAPAIAAKEENITIDPKKLIADIEDLKEKYDLVLVEGAGGATVPITHQADSTPYLISELIKDLNLPTIVVNRPDLGTINHTVLTIEHLKSKKINVLGFITSGYAHDSKDIAIRTAPEEITSITKVKCLMKFPLLNHLKLQAL